MFALTKQFYVPPQRGRPVIWQQVRFHPRTGLLLSLHNGVYVWDVAKGEQVGMIGSPSTFFTAFSLSLDGSLIALGTVQGTVTVWQPDWQDLAHMNVPGAVENRLVAISDFDGRIDSLAFHPREPVICCKDNFATKLWSTTSGMLLRTLLVRSPEVDHLAYTSDGHRLAMGNLNALQIRRSSDGRLLESYAMGGRVRCLSSHPTGEHVACASWDGAVTVWDWRHGQVWRAPRLHEGGTWTVAYSPDGSLLASAGLDQEIRVWDTQTGEQVDALTGSLTPIMSVAFDHTGTLLASTQADGVLNIWARSSP